MRLAFRFPPVKLVQYNCDMNDDTSPVRRRRPKAAFRFRDTRLVDVRGLEEAIALREAIQRVGEAVAAGTQPQPADVARINRAGHLEALGRQLGRGGLGPQRPPSLFAGRGCSPVS